jgi:hypothetical protein
MLTSLTGSGIIAERRRFLKMMKTSFIAAAILVLALGTAAANPDTTNVVINEIYADPPGTYDGAEFIELYNPTASPIDISGWVLTGTEYGGATYCGGEDRWQFPASTTIAAGGYIVVAKDAHDGDDGFFENFGFECDFEMVDTTFVAEHDYAGVPNMTLLDNDPNTGYSDEIQLVGGRGYGVICGSTSHADVVYLYTSPTFITLVDLVEYVDLDYCTADPCTGDDTVDDNAFPGIPYFGNTLGRDAGGKDTDNSDVDFTMMVPTPLAANVQNTPPWVRDVFYSPIPPNEAQPTNISARATDNSSVDSVHVYYNVDGAGWAMVVATTLDDTLYTGSIPAQPDGSQVEYYVRAIDDQAAKMNYPGGGASDPYSYSVGYTDIYDIQFVPSGGDESPLVGQAVNVRGIVTAAKGLFTSASFWIHDGNGIFEGIQCYAPSYDGAINEGDEITLCGTVSEYFNQTEVGAHFADALIVHSTGNPNYGYADVTTAEVAATNVDAERYESQLCRVTNATVTQLPDSYGQWLVRDASATDAEVDDWAYYYYEPELGDVLDELRGIVMYSYEEYKIEPRYDEDFVGPPSASSARYSPVPPNSSSQVEVTAVFRDNSDIASGTLYWSLSASGPWTPVVMAQQVRDVEETWAASIGPFGNGSRVYYYAECTDDSGMDARVPGTGYSYSLYVGIEDISDVQTVSLGGDASPLDGLAINVEGYVTAEPGIYNDNTFYIADATGAWNGIMVYDRTGTATLERGDYVVVCGEVDEYYGQTQIALHFAECVQQATPPREPVSAVSIETKDLQSVLYGEQYESVYVHAEDCVVYDVDVAYGEWAISNLTASDTCRVGDYGTYDYVPQLSDNVYVKGIVAFSFGNYKIEPRGNEDIAANPVGIPDDAVGEKFGLSQNMPNPFNPKTTIAFSLTTPSDVVLEIFDVAGRKVATLVDERLPAGPYNAEWTGFSDGGERVASGVYFYRLRAGERETSRKMVLLK